LWRLSPEQERLIGPFFPGCNAIADKSYASRFTNSRYEIYKKSRIFPKN